MSTQDSDSWQSCIPPNTRNYSQQRQILIAIDVEKGDPVNCGHTAEEHSAIIARLWERRFGTTPEAVATRVEAELKEELDASTS